MTIVNDGKEFFEAGCDGYITKPYKREHLIELIQSHISL
jgi:CheY-like chemotaxis protein